MRDLTSKFQEVADEREIAQYTEQDCNECPGKKLCVEIFDRLVPPVGAYYVRFPCGLELSEGEETETS